MQGTQFDPWSEKIPHASEQLSPCTTTTEAPMPRAHAPHQEKSPQWEAHALQQESSSCLPQLEKSLSSNEDTAEPKINQ